MNADRPSPRPPINLLIVGHDAGLSGAERSLLDIIDRLDPDEFRPTVVVPSPGPFVDALRRRGITCHCWLPQRWIHYRKPAPAAGASPSARLGWLLRQPMLRSLLALLTLPIRLPLLAALAARYRSELVYSNTLTMLDGALLARLLKLPHVWHLRESVAGNADLYWPGPASWLPRFIRRNAAHVIVNSQALRRELFGTDDSVAITVIPNGVIIDDRLSDRPASSRNTGFRTALIGRLNPRKGIPVYLEALAQLAPRYPDSRHWIVGEGNPDYLEFLRQEAQRLGVLEQVEFTGFLHDIRALLGEVDVIVNASFQEPFGRTLIEAMAAGVPVVATRSGGPEEIIVDGCSGLLVTPGDSLALAGCIARLLDDRELARRMGEAGRQRVQEHYDLTHTAASVIAQLRLPQP